MPFTGPQLDLIYRVLLSAFDRNELRRVVRISTNEDLDTLASDTLPFADQLFATINWANRHDCLLDLLRAAKESKPTRPDLSELFEQMSAARTPPTLAALESTRQEREFGLGGQRVDELLMLAGSRGVDLARLLQASMQMGSASTPAPRFDDLFEIVRYPEEIYPAIFRGDPGRLIAPYHVPHVAGRVGVDDIQGELRGRLQTASRTGALLVLSPAGLGKTREAAELARQLCMEGWIICVAKGESDALMNPTADFPEELRSRRVLFVIDDLHKRVVSTTQESRPYADRLNAFLEFAGRFFLPGESYVIGTARNEPQYQSQLALDSDHPIWRRFDRYELPGFSQEGLVAVLISLAGQAHVDLDPAEAPRLVADSDLRLRTIVENVRRCQWQQEPLTAQNWKPAQGQSWAMLFQEAHHRWPDVLHVYQSLYMIRAAGLPTRTDYVVKLGNFLAGSDVRPAAENLVNMGILGMHGDRLDAFGDEQLVDSLRNHDSAPPDLEAHWDEIIKAFCAIAAARPEWVEDLHVLAIALLMTANEDKARAVANEAIKLAPARAEGYYLRGLACYDANDFVAAEADFSAAIARDAGDSALYHYWRGLALYYQAKDEAAIAEFTGAVDRDSQTPEYLYWRALSHHAVSQYAAAEADLTAAIAADTGNSPLYPYQRGRTRLEMEHYGDALADFSTAIERDVDDTAFLYYFRGQAHHAQQEYAEAAADFRKAIELDPDDFQAYFGLAHAHYGLEQFEEAEDDFTQAIERSEGNVPALYFWRGTTRFALGKFERAEKDVTAAINQNATIEPSFFYRRGRARYFLGKLADAEADFSTAIEHDAEYISRYRFWRGMTRYYQQRYAEAEADFTAAIEIESEADIEYFYRRGRTRYELRKLDEAEADFTAAIEGLSERDAACFYWRGTTRYERGALADAETDLTTAIELTGGEDAQSVFGRGMARYYQQKYSEAEADFALAVALDPEGDPNYYFRRGRARYNQNKMEEAAADFSAAIRHSDVVIPVYYYWRAMTAYEQEEFNLAEANLTVAIEHDERAEPTFYFWRGMARYYQQKYRNAEADFTSALARASEPDPLLYYRRGRALFYQEKYAEAEADLTAAIDQSEAADPILFFWRGIACFEQADFAGAERDLSAAIDGATQFDPVDYYWRGRARFQLENYSAAEADLTAALDGELGDPEVYFWRGMARAEQGRLSEADMDFEAAAEQGLDSPDLYRVQSWVNIQLDRLAQARTACEALSRRAPQSPDAAHAWGDWHLAGGELTEALARFEAAHSSAPASHWHSFCHAYALALAGHMADAERILAESTVQASTVEKRRMVRWLETWVERQPDGASTAPIEAFVMSARSTLGHNAA